MNDLREHSANLRDNDRSAIGVKEVKGRGPVCRLILSHLTRRAVRSHEILAGCVEAKVWRPISYHGELNGRAYTYCHHHELCGRDQRSRRGP